MNITSRRLDFLRTIKQIYDNTSLPVHYIRVAEKLGVSKWSAYDMLKSLEKDGLLSRHYEVNNVEKHPGRAMIMFYPTQLLVQIVNAASSDVKASTKEWIQVKDRLLSAFDKMEPDKAGELMEQLAAELPVVENPLAACAYVVTMLIAQLQNLGETSLSIVRSIMKGAVKAESALAMIAGAIMGSLARAGLPNNCINQLSGFLPGFQNNLARLDSAEQTLLMDFLGQALEKTA